MKRLLNVFLSILLLITTAVAADNRIYAEEVENITVSETEVPEEESSEITGEEAVDETNKATADFSKQESDGETETDDQNDTGIYEETEVSTESIKQDETSILNSEGDENDGLTVFLNSSGDLIIIHEDTDWLMALCEPEDYPEDQQKGVIVFVNPTGAWIRCSNTYEGPVYYYEDGKVIVPNAYMRAHGIINDSYTFVFMLTAFGSGMKEYRDPISITGICEEHPYDINILPEDNYDILITSR
ncbi:MAG: hypothetical protein J5365_04800, partial [Erysipelotrichaceae bacterium]|nr:hypothetical protein [Erysipelotrichaceae bacterium]